LKSEQHLSEGIVHFENLEDEANHALLLSNMGRLRRMEVKYLHFNTASRSYKLES